MVRIYISSTFQDLSTYRAEVIQALRHMGHDVITMEEYGSRDERPLALCLQHVASTDLYIGIFAQRYGFIPTEDNPGQLSITELEYTCAKALNRPRLLFTASRDSRWRNEDLESDDRRARALALQERVRLDRACEEFIVESDLVTKVLAAVANWERGQRSDEHVYASTYPSIEASGPTQAGLSEIEHDALVVYCEADRMLVDLLRDRLPSSTGRGKFRLRDLSDLLSASRPVDLRRLDAEARRCHTTVLVLSDDSLDILKRDPLRGRLILDILKARTGALVGICTSEMVARQTAEWPLVGRLTLDGASPRETAAADLGRRLVDELFARCPRFDESYIGLPVIIVAMTRDEAARLEREPDQYVADPSSGTLDRFLAFRNLVPNASTSFSERYGEVREGWRPFADISLTILDLIEAVAQKLNERPGQQRDPLIKIQIYPFYMPTGHTAELRGIYRDISRTGSLVVVDEVSLFHRDVWSRFVQSPFFQSEHASLVTISPFDHAQMLGSEHRHLAMALGHELEVLTSRYQELDPQCEFGAEDEWRLRRWLHAGLPRVVQSLIEPPANRRAMGSFFDERDVTMRHQVAPRLFPRGRGIFSDR
jgi:hypothetical protein